MNTNMLAPLLCPSCREFDRCLTTCICPACHLLSFEDYEQASASWKDLSLAMTVLNDAGIDWLWSFGTEIVNYFLTIGEGDEITVKPQWDGFLVDHSYGMEFTGLDRLPQIINHLLERGA